MRKIRIHKKLCENGKNDILLKIIVFLIFLLYLSIKQSRDKNITVSFYKKIKIINKNELFFFARPLYFGKHNL